MHRSVRVFITDPAPWATLEPYELRPELLAHFERFSREAGLPLYLVAVWPWLDRLPGSLMVLRRFL